MIRAVLWSLAAGGCAVPTMPGNPLRADADQDGLSLVDGDCDDGDPDVGATLRAYVDADGDGLGSGELQEVGSCELGAGWSEVAGDCDDGQVDLLDHVDGWVDDDDDGFGTGQAVAQDGCSIGSGYADNDFDCDDTTDQVRDSLTVYVDDDEDGFGTDVQELSFECDVPPQRSTTSGDCDDTLEDVNPGATELCANGLDDDCDSYVDDDDPSGVGVDWYPDTDGDGWGDETESPISSCGQPQVDHVANGDDCDDANPGLPSGLIDYCFHPGDQTCGLGPVVAGCGRGDTFLMDPIPLLNNSIRPSVGGFDADASQDVLLGAWGSDPPFPDVFRVIFDPLGAGRVVQYQLPVAHDELNTGATQGVLLERDGDPSDAELAIVDFRDDYAIDGDVLLIDDPVPDVAGVVQITYPPQAGIHVVHGHGQPSGVLLGYAVAAADLVGGDGRDDLVLTAPNLAYDVDLVYILPGDALPSSLTDPEVITLLDASYTVDALGVGAATTRDLDGSGVDGLALLSLGTPLDGTEVVVLSPDEVVDGGGITTSPFAWYETAESPASSDRGPSVAFGDVDGDGANDLVLGTSDGATDAGHIYVLGLSGTDPTPTSAALAASVVLELPDASCATTLAVLDDADPVLVMGCPDWPLYSGIVLTVRASDLPGSGVLDARNTSQMGPDLGYWSYLASGGLVAGADLDADGRPEVVSSIYDDTYGQAFFSFEAGDIPNPIP